MTLASTVQRSLFSLFMHQIVNGIETTAASVDQLSFGDTFLSMAGVKTIREETSKMERYTSVF
jgi:hypothetical protein